MQTQFSIQILSWLKVWNTFPPKKKKLGIISEGEWMLFLPRKNGTNSMRKTKKSCEIVSLSIFASRFLCICQHPKYLQREEFCRVIPSITIFCKDLSGCWSNARGSHPFEINPEKTLAGKLKIMWWNEHGTVLYICMQFHRVLLLSKVFCSKK